MSKSETRRVAAIGNGCVIPEKAGNQRLSKRRGGDATNAAGFPLSWERRASSSPLLSRERHASWQYAEARSQRLSKCRGAHATNAAGFPLSRERRASSSTPLSRKRTQVGSMRKRGASVCRSVAAIMRRAPLGSRFRGNDEQVRHLHFRGNATQVRHPRESGDPVSLILCHGKPA